MAKEPMAKKERKQMPAPAKVVADFVDGFHFCFDTARVECGVVKYIELNHQPTNAERAAARAEGIGIKVVLDPEQVAWLEGIRADSEYRRETREKRAAKKKVKAAKAGR